MSLQGELTGVRWPVVWLLCVFVCSWASGCRRESPPEKPSSPEPTHTEQPAAQPAPSALTDSSSSPDTAAGDDRPSDSFQPPPLAKVTILSIEPIPDGGTDGASGLLTMVEGGIVQWASDEPVTDAAPTDQERRRARKGGLRGDPLEGIEQELVSKWDAIQSLASKLEMYFHSKNEDYEITTEGMGTRDCLKKDGRMLVRTIFGNSIRIEVEDEDPPIRWTGERVVKVFDGEYLYTQIETYEGKTATKQMPMATSFMAVGGSGLIMVLRSVRKLQRAADAEIDGRSMYVFTGYNPIDVRVEYVIDKETGLLHSIKREWTVEDRTRRFKFVKHEINPDFPEDHFTFTPSEGVVVEDRTRAASAPSATDPQP